MKKIFILLVVSSLWGCKSSDDQSEKKWETLSNEVRQETLRSWKAYGKYAWGHDVLLPISKSYSDWYNQPLSISAIDAYSTLKMIGFHECC